MKEVVIRLPRFIEGDAKSCLRTIARRFLWKMYSQEIETGAFGWSRKDGKISVDTVGRWIFGIPGYKGNLVVIKFEDNEATVGFPRKSPKIVHQFVTEMKEKTEKNSLSGQKP